MLIAFLKKWEMAATTTNERSKGTCIAWVPKNDITFPVQLQTSQYYKLLWSGKKATFAWFLLIFVVDHPLRSSQSMGAGCIELYSIIERSRKGRTFFLHQIGLALL